MISESDFKLIFSQLPQIYLILKPNPPEFTIVASNDAQVKANQSEQSLIGLGVFEAFDNNPAHPKGEGLTRLRQSLLTVIQTKKQHRMMVQRYDIFNPASKNFESKYWSATNLPVLDDAESLVYIIHAVEDVTDKMILKKKVEREHRRQQREMTQAVLNAQENQRFELGRELHDNVNQVLTIARLYIEYALSKADKQDDMLEASCAYISKAIHEVRQLSRSLMPPSLGVVSLKESIEELLFNIKSLKNLELQFDYLLPNEEGLNDDLKLAIFRITQEQLNNIIKHAKATKVFISITQLNGVIEMSVSDNGIGFDLTQQANGLGLRNITSRASLFGGQADIQSQPGQGSRLSIRFPIMASHEQKTSGSFNL